MDEEILDRARPGYYEELTAFVRDELAASGFDPRVRQSRRVLKETVCWETAPSWSEHPEWAVPPGDAIPYSSWEIVIASDRIHLLEPGTTETLALAYVSQRVQDGFRDFVAERAASGGTSRHGRRLSRETRLRRTYCRFGPPLEAVAKKLDEQLAEDGRRGELDLLSALDPSTAAPGMLLAACRNAPQSFSELIPPVGAIYEYFGETIKGGRPNPLVPMECEAV